jgi:hypothetical protein
MKKSGRRQWIIMGAMLLGLVLIVGLIIDIRMLNRKRSTASTGTTRELQSIVLNMDSTKPYRDANGLFEMRPPSGWDIQTRPEGLPYNVVMYSPNGPDISITASRVDHNSIKKLKREIKNIEYRQALDTHIKETEFHGMPAIERTLNLHHSKVIALDFVQSNVAHHIQISIPHGLEEKYEPVLRDVVQTYTPTP